MSFAIRGYDRSLVEGMVSLYNGETSFERHIAPLTTELFLALVEAKSYFDPSGLLVAQEQGEVVGWVHACVAPATEPWHDPQKRAASIRLLIYPRDRLRVGAALVAEATDWLGKSGQQELEAGSCRSGYPFYRGLWMGGEPMTPATMPHVHLAFEVGGYKLNAESVFMVGRLASAPPARVPPGLELVEAPAAMAHTGMRESWTGFAPMRVRALVGGSEVGSLGWVVLPQVAARLGSPCVNIWSLGVGAEHRRKGIASALVAHALARGYASGARFASVGTQLWNAPAQATYAKFGFQPHCLLGERIKRPAADGEAG
ncbi:MAG: GNAT family N-acetyltransferase [Armatimonadota bacterium]